MTFHLCCCLRLAAHKQLVKYRSCLTKNTFKRCLSCADYRKQLIYINICTRYKLDRALFVLLLLISWTTLLSSCKLKKKHLQKRDLVFMLVSFSIVSFSLALCGRRPRTRGLFSPSSKRTLHQPFLTSPHQLECEAAFFHTQSQRKRRKGLYNVDFGFGSFSPQFLSILKNV